MIDPVEGLSPDAATIGFLAGRFGLAVDRRTAVMTPVARGAMGVVWRFETGVAGSVFAVKELLWGGDERQVRREVGFQEAATSRGLVDAPTNHRTVMGTFLCELPEHLGSATVRLFDWVDGIGLSADSHGSAAWLGRVLGGLHALSHPVDHLPPDPWYDTCPDETRWHTLIRQGTTVEAPWVPALRAAVPLLAAANRQLEAAAR